MKKVSTKICYWAIWSE